MPLSDVMKFHICKKCIVKYFPKWLIHGLLRPYYNLAIRAVVATFINLAGLQAIYLAGSAARNRLNPGVSDIDFLFVIKDAANSEQTRSAIKLRFRILKRLFFQLQPVDELAIFSQLEITNDAQNSVPHIFSVPERLKFLWGEQNIGIQYQRSHELPLLSALWRKLLIVNNSQLDCPYYNDHICAGVADVLSGVEQRLGLPQSDLNLLNRLRRAVQAFDSTTKQNQSADCNFQIKKFTDLHSHAVVDRRKILFLTCSIKKLEQVDLKMTEDFCFDSGALFPINIKDFPFILTPQGSPQIFDSLRLCTNADSPIAEKVNDYN